ncbi:lasso peptide biosynthesis PqqD family chaperone [Paenibacillus illinoisensis]|uniref:lasso peptide biosynthesis PqqD family chaperone n=1 Tax=Paenibacillus illinoisensis TaxID=59845 RepID=UPI000FDC6C8D|nr:lasso peptide biosynthesis PqqD family chaperone [Paenibacillus illinoisensis]
MKSTKQFDWKDRVKQKEGNLVSDMGGEKVMMSIQSGKYYNLGSTGGRIWELLSQERTIADLVDILASEYEIDTDTCQVQVIPFLEHMSREGLIDVVHED